MEARERRVNSAAGGRADSVAPMTESAVAALPDGRVDHVSTKTRRTMLGVALALYVTGTIGSNVAFGWLDTRPELVLALSSRNRNLLGSVPFINPLAYALIGFSRVMLVAVVLYLVGRWFGPRALGWVENQLGELPSIYRVGWVVVVLMPGSNLVCLLAGHRRMDVRRFVTAAAGGTVLKLGVLWIGGKIFEDQIRAFFDFIEGYQWWLVAAAFAFTFAQAAWRARSRVGGAGSSLGDPPPPRPPGEAT